MRIITILLTVVLIAATTALAQQKVPPPPKPAPDGPSLEATMKFIQEKLSGMELSYRAEYISNGKRVTNNHHDKITGVRADPTNCTLGWHSQSDTHHVDSSSDFMVAWDIHLSFKDVGKLEVNSSNASWAKYPALQWVETPDHYFVRLKAVLDKKRFSAHRTTGEVFDTESSTASFAFADEEMANRVAKALVHAVELCGGGSKPEPF